MPPPGPDPIDGERPGRAIGALGEQFAADHLERLGLQVIARNLRLGAGEIDLIAFDGRTLVFAEVKSARLTANSGAGAPVPLERLRAAQRLRLRRLAVRWLAETAARPRAQAIRFDAIGVLLDGRGELVRLEHLEGAW